MIKAKLKMKMKIVFQNHYYEDNYDDNLILPGVKEITKVQTNWCYQLQDILGSNEVITSWTRLMPASLKQAPSSVKSVWEMGPMYCPLFIHKDQSTLVLSHIQHV